jgi:predicted DNA-binding transcriptional regulator AlpA
MNTISPGDKGRAPEGADQLLPARAVMTRYGICDRTLDRWLVSERLSFPRPTMINKRRYFRLDEIEKWERAQAAKNSKSRKQATAGVAA